MLVCICMWIGRWSDESASSVVHVVSWNKLLEISVMSGEVGCWFLAGGFRVGVFVLRDSRVDPWISSSRSSPRWSGLCECQRVEWALMSPVIMRFE